MCGERTPYIHRHVVCVCVCVCVSEQKGNPSFSTGGGSGDRMAIHSQRRKPSCSTGGGGGRVLLLLWPARWGEGMPQEAEHKTAAVGEGMPQKQRDILFHRAKPQEGYPVPQGGGKITP